MCWAGSGAQVYVFSAVDTLEQEWADYISQRFTYVDWGKSVFILFKDEQYSFSESMYFIRLWLSSLCGLMMNLAAIYYLYLE